jgi:G:T-mismatch repair DNA endonuclease (very short patch repair protein)
LIRLCSVTGCNNNYLAKGFCNKHYLRNKTYGDPLHVVVRICSVTGCNKKHKGRGYCVNHLIHYRNHGDPLVYADPEETKKKQSTSLKGKTPWNKGKTGIFSEKTRRGWSEKRKGQTSWMKGKKHSEETKKKISNATKGRIVSVATRKKMSERIISAETRKKISERIISAETRKKISLAHKGRKYPDRITSLETRKKMSESRKGRIVSEATRKKMSIIHKGRKYPDRIVSLETKKKISDANSTPERKAQQREIRSKQKFPFKDSKIELQTQQILKDNKISFETQKLFKLSKSYHRADITIESDKVIEVNGDYWHFNPKYYSGKSIQRMRGKKLKVKEKWEDDKYIVNGMKAQGYKVLVVWESELKKELDKTTKKILKFAKS